MSSCTVRILSPQAALVLVATFALAGCQRDAGKADQTAEIAWARAALERNPHIEVVAADAQARVFTVRDRNSGEVHAVRLDELAAAPVAQLQAQVATRAVAPAAPQLETPPAPAEPVAASPEAPSAEATAAQPAGPTPVVAHTGVPPGYTIERIEGGVRISGPGVSIVSAGPASAPRNAPNTPTAEPIICEGRRMMHLDSRNIYVEGNAITARGGCELYITNSHIIASGTGIVVQDAVVHISNSRIEGADGSFDAADRARLFVRSSTFQGVPKRTQLAMVTDQGGNRWQ
jgi:hypothetical protein